MGNSKFQIGEVAIYVGGAHSPIFYQTRYGMEATITDPLAIRPGEYAGAATSSLPRYGVKFSDGVDAWVLESSLRKRPQPGDTTDHFRSELKPCEPQHLKQLDRWLNPVPSTTTLESNMRRAITCLREVVQIRAVLDDLYGLTPKRFYPEFRHGKYTPTAIQSLWAAGALYRRPDHFFGGFDA